ncbi:MAG TPA: hypothetical protein VD861_17140, partial [Pyrinomonadaceae bacterium]|nr:hypothetical protein [Pyrinomonadaceae bacterium]
VLREKGDDDRLIAGEGLVYWLGDEDGEGDGFCASAVAHDARRSAAKNTDTLPLRLCAFVRDFPTRRRKGAED